MTNRIHELAGLAEGTTVKVRAQISEHNPNEYTAEGRVTFRGCGGDLIVRIEDGGTGGGYPFYDGSTIVHDIEVTT
jgi:hypothetical protein